MRPRRRSSTKRKIVTVSTDETSPSSSKRKNNTVVSTDETSPSSSKRKKQEQEQEQPQQPETEKRLRRFRPQMTIGIYDRIERALNQRLYLLAITKSSNETLSREYKVLGQTANVYTVVIAHIPSCTCPDYAKGHLCKHIIFVLHRVLKVSRNSPLIYQQALLTIELNEIFTKADAQTNDLSILAEQQIREAYHAETGDPGVIVTTTAIEQKPITNDDECPICFESMFNEKSNIIFCSTSCGNNIHKNCFDKWRIAKLSMSEPVTCPFCRVEWKINSKKPIHHHHHSSTQGYLNLAAYSTTDDYDDELDDLYFNYW